MRGISVIIPVFRDDAALEHLIKALTQLDISEIIVADGERRAPVDRILNLQQETKINWISAPKGRGAQIAAGLAAASHPLVWVLHADSYPQIGSVSEIRRSLRDPWTALTCFPITFRHPSKRLKLFANFSLIESSITTFGDQGFAFRRDDYLGLNLDLAAFPLLEDVALRRGLKRLGKIRKAKLSISTSARRFERLGIWRTQIRNAEILLSYWRGTCPAVLYDQYYAPIRQTTQAYPPSWPARPVSTQVRVAGQRTASDFPTA